MEDPIVVIYLATEIQLLPLINSMIFSSYSLFVLIDEFAFIVVDREDMNFLPKKNKINNFDTR